MKLGFEPPNLKLCVWLLGGGFIVLFAMMIDIGVGLTFNWMMYLFLIPLVLIVAPLFQYTYNKIDRLQKQVKELKNELRRKS